MLFNKVVEKNLYVITYYVSGIRIRVEVFAKLRNALASIALSQ